jgi:uroporphyrinogen-III synthase
LTSAIQPDATTAKQKSGTVPTMSGLPPLAGYTVAVTADRRRAEQVELLRRRGAAVVEAPTVRTVPLVDDEDLRDRVEQLVASPPDVVVLLTALGIRSLVVAAEGMGLDEALLDVLAETRLLVRGPKALGAATSLGLDVEWWASTERSVEVAEQLAAEAAAGASITVVRDGADRPFLAETLAGWGARTVDVPVYRWERPQDPAPAERLVSAICSRTVDVVTFTSSPAIRNLVAIAEECGLGDALLAGFHDSVVPACVGPVCAETGQAVGMPKPILPRRARLGAMVQAVAATMAERSRSLRLAGRDVVLQGGTVLVDGTELRLADRERGVLHALADAGGAVVPKRTLLKAVWADEAADEHAVEVTVARLRRRLGPAGDAVVTIPRRGYRIV